MNFFVVILFLALAAGGCTSESKARAQAQAAFLAGQNAALRQQQQEPGVAIIGPVQNPQVPWVAGLTLAQAIATAMKATGVRRIVVVSAAPIGTVPSPARPNPPRHDPGDGSSVASDDEFLVDET